MGAIDEAYFLLGIGRPALFTVYLLQPKSKAVWLEVPVFEV